MGFKIATGFLALLIRSSLSVDDEHARSLQSEQVKRLRGQKDKFVGGRQDSKRPDVGILSFIRTKDINQDDHMEDSGTRNLLEDYNCQGYKACNHAAAYIATQACRGRYSCYDAGRHGHIFPYSCVGESSCGQLAHSGYARIAGWSCLGPKACYKAGLAAHSYVTIGQSSCVGEGACRGMSGVVRIGKHSCKCDECCSNLKHGTNIGDFQCNTKQDNCTNAVIQRQPVQLGLLERITIASSLFGLLVNSPEPEAKEIIGSQLEDGMTVFIPNDEAFSAFPDGMLSFLYGRQGRNAAFGVLRKHVVPGLHPSANWTEGTTFRTLDESFNITITTSDNTTKANNAPVITYDIDDKFTAAHEIGGLLLPGIFDSAKADPDLSSFVDAIAAANLELALNSGMISVFAPTNRAIDALPDGTSDYLLNDPKLLTDLILYHVVEGSALHDEIVDGPITTLNGENVTLKAGDPFTVNGVPILADSTLAVNGLIHKIDQVLVPPSFEQLLRGDSRSQGTSNLIDSSSCALNYNISCEPPPNLEATSCDNIPLLTTMCEDRPSEMTFRYNGQGCSSSDGNGMLLSCEDEYPTGPPLAYEKALYIIIASHENPREIYFEGFRHVKETVTANAVDRFEATTNFTVYDPRGSTNPDEFVQSGHIIQTMRVDTRCSPGTVGLGERFGGFQVVGFVNDSQNATTTQDVTLSFHVNNDAPVQIGALGLLVANDILGESQLSSLLGPRNAVVPNDLAKLEFVTPIDLAEPSQYHLESQVVGKLPDGSLCYGNDVLNITTVRTAPRPVQVSHACHCPSGCVKDLNFMYTGDACNGSSGCVDFASGPTPLIVRVSVLAQDSSIILFSGLVATGETMQLQAQNCLPPVFQIRVLDERGRLHQTVDINSECMGEGDLVLFESYGSFKFTDKTCDVSGSGV